MLVWGPRGPAWGTRGDTSCWAAPCVRQPRGTPGTVRTRGGGHSRRRPRCPAPPLPRPGRRKRSPWASCATGNPDPGRAGTGGGSSSGPPPCTRVCKAPAAPPRAGPRTREHTRARARRRRHTRSRARERAPARARSPRWVLHPQPRCPRPDRTPPLPVHTHPVGAQAPPHFPAGRALPPAAVPVYGAGAARAGPSRAGQGCSGQGARPRVPPRGTGRRCCSELVPSPHPATGAGPRLVLGAVAGNPGGDEWDPPHHQHRRGAGQKRPCLEVWVPLPPALCWVLEQQGVPAPAGRAGSRPPSPQPSLGVGPPCAPSPARRGGCGRCRARGWGESVRSRRRNPALGRTHCAAFPSAETRCEETGSAHPQRATRGETEAPAGWGSDSPLHRGLLNALL